MMDHWSRWDMETSLWSGEVDHGLLNTYMLPPAYYLNILHAFAASACYEFVLSPWYSQDIRRSGHLKLAPVTSEVKQSWPMDGTMPLGR